MGGGIEPRVPGGKDAPGRDLAQMTSQGGGQRQSGVFALVVSVVFVGKPDAMAVAMMNLAWMKGAAVHIEWQPMNTGHGRGVASSRLQSWWIKW